eukprot:TRINITY_DN97941_c0_g1_i1.p1 TRINITY_DN97941_c0_g1~~TRINITY_DN97941_c0_g1_i1.p1  ORF type:complete len:282 (+),score=38.69 TRINITY_DN97941_c0_g1_i1:82-927(+)
MATWADPIVAKLARQGCEGEFCGLVLCCSWPMPAEVLSQYEKFRQRLTEAMPAEAYVYPGSTLHCTICTFRSFKTGPLDAAARESLRKRFLPVLAAASASTMWPNKAFRLRMCKPTLEGSAGIFHFDDCDGAVAAMRRCLRDAIVEFGGCAAVGGADRSKGVPLPGGSPGELPPHLPDIIHSTALRWSADPADRTAALEAFGQVAASWEPVEVIVPCCRAVFEDVPYMHITSDDSLVWWQCNLERGEKRAASPGACARLKDHSEVSKEDLLDGDAAARHAV